MNSRQSLRRGSILTAGAALVATVVTVLGAALPSSAGTRWSEDEIAILRSLWISELEPLRPDPTNRYADDPTAASLGHQLFFDQGLSIDGEVSCATCHIPELGFQDGKPLGEGVGITDRRTMPIASTAYSAWQFWDGRKDSQWSQALGPLESAVEHGGSRAQYVHRVARNYRHEYEAVFGPLPDLTGVPHRAGPVEDPPARAAWEALPPALQDEVSRVYANIGKAIAAYERKLQYGPSPFDLYVGALLDEGQDPGGLLNPDAVEGARLFIGKAGCVNCHNGPLFTDDYFHNTGVPEGAPILGHGGSTTTAFAGGPIVRPAPVRDLGRATGGPAVLADEFNCRSAYSDAGGECPELDFMVVDSEEMVRAFKTPSLRNVADRAPYMHAGQIATLEDVVRHYSRAPRAPAGRSELHPVRLKDREIREIVAFLRSLSGPLTTQPMWLRAPAEER